MNKSDILGIIENLSAEEKTKFFNSLVYFYEEEILEELSYKYDVIKRKW